jgi:ABC-2 type transport system permease protein
MAVREPHATPAGSPPLDDPPSPAAARRGGALVQRHRGLAWLVAREVVRVLKLWTQTILAPVVASFLFILVFGLSLGGRIAEIGGTSYEVFIVPGLITMAMAQAAYANNSSSLFQARFDRYLHDILAAPVRAWEVNLAFSLGGAVRALAIGAGLLTLSIAVTDVPVREPLVLILAVALGLAMFSALGVIAGIYAQTFDHVGFVNNIVILPLAFLGGTFYSVEQLPSPWHEVSHVNPVFFLINAVRYGFLGTADASVALSLGVTTALTAVFVGWSSWLFHTGRRLKP